MAFENLSDKLQAVFKRLRGKGTLTEKDLKEAMREVKLALLEADVNFKVVKDFTNRVTQRAVGTDVLSSLTPGQQVIKIVNEEMIALMGSDDESKLNYGDSSPTVYMMVGLQGAGKTTMSAKLANMLKTRGKKPLLAACDIYRPAAIKQLQILGDQISVPVFEMGTETSPVVIAQKAVERAKVLGCNLVIVDTAGRLQIDETLMDELAAIKETVHPTEILLTVDAMTGQEAVNVAKAFEEKVGITGVIGVGEKISDIEVFHPDRMASRILGMGDVLTMIEKAQANIDEEEARKISERAAAKDFNLDDFLSSMQQVRKMSGGNLNSLLGMLPGGLGTRIGEVDVDEKAIKRIEAMITSMTPEERRKPQILNASRKRRIVKGSGSSIQELNRLLKQYEQMKTMMKQFTGKGSKRKMANMMSQFSRGKMPFGM